MDKRTIRWLVGAVLIPAAVIALRQRIARELYRLLS